MIKELSSDVIDQISAGEVIERPAQLVKELIENALDANAKTIGIECRNGGRSVVVVDDGDGIKAEELVLAISRHATSKLSAFDDLSRLNSFGFRGEALASIAAVAKVELISRQKSDQQAHRIQVEFSQIDRVRPVAGNFGTSIRVDDLFANLPVRLKFLKSDSAENSQIRQIVRALALANESIRFRLKLDAKEELHLEPESFLHRAQNLLGHKLYFASGGDERHRVEVACSSPGDVQGNSRGIYLFVQGRYIQDRSLQAAVLEAYRTLLMHGEFPFCVLRLVWPPDEVDCNVHPTKASIRFQDPSLAFRLVQKTVRSILEKAPWAVPTPASKNEISMRAERVSEPMAQYQSFAFTNPVPTNPGVEQLQLLRVEAAHPVQMQRWQDLKVIGQSLLTYIVTERAGALVLVDQHAAHERVLFERLKKALTEKKQTEQQHLLIPLILQISVEGMEALSKVQPQLQSLGISFEPIGPDQLAINCIPTFLSESAIATALVKFAQDLVENSGSFAVEHKINDTLASMACHSAIRAGQNLSNEQMVSLLQQMDEFPLSGFCPHGRPVSIEWAEGQIEREFGRIV